MTAPAPQQEYFLVTRDELDKIKNDCACPESETCVGCPFADGDDNTRASGLGCNFIGANALMEEVLSRPAPAPDNLDKEYSIKGYVTFSKAERDKIMAFLSQPMGKETLREMREIVRRHEEESLRHEARK